MNPRPQKPQPLLEGTLVPRSEEELAEIIRSAGLAGTSLAVVGGGTRAGLGHKVSAAAELSTRGLSGVTLYSPEELVVSAKAGTPVAEIERLLATKRQRLDFEPMDHRPLYGTKGEPTIGGVVATNASGPRRVVSGAARDALIGLRAVTGAGEIIKNGGRVMKNVTGYDLLKLFAGSMGTLAVITEVTFKILPVPENEITLVREGLGDAEAVAALTLALGTPFGVTGAAHRPSNGDSPSRTYLRLEGLASSSLARADKLALALGWSRPSIEDAAHSARLWADIRDVRALAAGDAPVWRVSVKPTDGPAVADAVRASYPAEILFDWGGGLLWLTGSDTTDAGASVVRAAVAAHGGHATLVRAPAGGSSAALFEPQPAAIVALNAELKSAFDPRNILNPGRVYPP
jgi:glycolate oxidase FAD binding subunit